MVLRGPRANIEAVNALNAKELKSAPSYESSWHFEYRDSCYVFVGGLNFELTEGDVVIVFSQWGEVIDCNLARDKDTGQSRGFAFVGFEDARSAALAVDNMNGVELAGRLVRVDHVKDYKHRVVQGEAPQEASGAEGKGFGVYNVTEHQRRISEAEREKRRKRIRQREQSSDHAAIFRESEHSGA